MLIVSISGHVGYKGLLCCILIKWCWVTEWLSDMIKCRDAIASKNTLNFSLHKCYTFLMKASLIQGKDIHLKEIYFDIW